MNNHSIDLDRRHVMLLADLMTYRYFLCLLFFVYSFENYTLNPGSLKFVYVENQSKILIKLNIKGLLNSFKFHKIIFNFVLGARFWVLHVMDW